MLSDVKAAREANTTIPSTNAGASGSTIGADSSSATHANTGGKYTFTSELLSSQCSHVTRIEANCIASSSTCEVVKRAPECQP